MLKRAADCPRGAVAPRGLARGAPGNCAPWPLRLGFRGSPPPPVAGRRGHARGARRLSGRASASSGRRRKPHIGGARGYAMPSMGTPPSTGRRPGTAGPPARAVGGSACRRAEPPAPFSSSCAGGKTCSGRAAPSRLARVYRRRTSPAAPRKWAPSLNAPGASWAGPPFRAKARRHIAACPLRGGAACPPRASPRHVRCPLPAPLVDPPLGCDLEVLPRGVRPLQPHPALRREVGARPRVPARPRPNLRLRGAGACWPATGWDDLCAAGPTSRVPNRCGTLIGPWRGVAGRVDWTLGLHIHAGHWLMCPADPARQLFGSQRRFHIPRLLMRMVLSLRRLGRPRGRRW